MCATRTGCEDTYWVQLSIMSSPDDQWMDIVSVSDYFITPTQHPLADTIPGQSMIVHVLILMQENYHEYQSNWSDMCAIYIQRGKAIGPFICLST